MFSSPLTENIKHVSSTSDSVVSTVQYADIVQTTPNQTTEPTQLQVALVPTNGAVISTPLRESAQVGDPSTSDQIPSSSPQNSTSRSIASVLLPTEGIVDPAPVHEEVTERGQKVTEEIEEGQAAISRALPPTDSNSLIQKQRSRKRIRDFDNWKRNIKQRKYNTGESVERKGVKSSRKVKGVCTEKCKRKCTQKISAQKQGEIHEAFWKLGSRERRADYLTHHVKKDKKRRETVSGTSRRLNSCFYFLPLEKNTTSVCKKFFLNTLAISPQMVTTAVDNAENGTTPQKSRRPAANKTKPRKIEEVRSHIKSFPKVESHYCRQHSKCEYLESSLSVQKMYKMYCEKVTNPVKLAIYRNIFNSEFNLRFHIPSKDRCDVCEMYKLIQHHTEETEEEHAQHLRRKEDARQMKEADKQNASSMTITMDLQQTIVCPKLSVGSAYYLRKLNIYNFTIFELSSSQGYCYTWTEEEGGKGATEISTCILKWLREKDDEGWQHIIMYSDTCGGQNRNKIVSTMCSVFLQTARNVKLIEQKFFEPGHSQMECDSMHSVLERCWSTRDVHLPSEYTDLMCNACAKPYKVCSLQYTDFLNFDAINRECFKSTAFNGIAKVRKIQYKRPLDQNEKHNIDIEFSRNITDEGQSIGNYRKRGSANNVVSPSLAYDRHLGITQEKKEDLLKLSRFLPADKSSYYKSLHTKE